MRILNCSEVSRLISLRVSDVVIKPFSLSENFNCTEKVFSKIVQTPDYQNVMRFVMDPSERQILDLCPVIQGTVITNQEAKELELKFKTGYRLPKIDINGNPIEPEVKEPEPEVEEKDEVDEEEEPESEDSTKSEEEEVNEGTVMPKMEFTHHKDQVSMSKAKSYSLMKPEMKDCEGLELKYTSSNPKILDIKDGKLIFNKKGRVTITATLINAEGQDVLTDSYVLDIK